MGADIVFQPSAANTVGVELELQLLQPHTFAFQYCADAIINRVDPEFKGRIKEEFLQSMLEINTRCCSGIEEAQEDLRQSLAHLDELTRSGNTLWYAASLHPVEKGSGEGVTDNPRYHRIMQELQIVGRRFITQGLHVHVGVSSADQAIQVNDAIRMYLPLLLALSTSSPFYASEDTGLLSYRTKLFEALPQAGLPGSLGDWNEFAAMVNLLISGGIIESVKDLWWDVRPNPDFGTVEIRICDLPCRFSHLMGVVALTHALVVTLLSRPQPRHMQMQILRANKWQALRHGLDGVFSNPVSATRQSMREGIADLIEMVLPAARQLGGDQYFPALYDILEHGTGAHRQRALMQEYAGDHRRMIATMQSEFFL